MILPMRFSGARVDLYGELLGATGLSSNILLSYHKLSASPASLVHPAFLVSECRRATQKYPLTDFPGSISTGILEACIIEGMQSSK